MFLQNTDHGNTVPAGAASGIPNRSGRQIEITPEFRHLFDFGQLLANLHCLAGTTAFHSEDGKGQLRLAQVNER